MICTYTKPCGWKCSRPVKKGEVNWCWQHMPPRDVGECSICMEQCKTGQCGGDKLFKTKCGHNFHKKCFGKWSQNQQHKDTVTCPNCREVIINNKPFDSDDASRERVRVWLDSLPTEPMVPPLDLERLQVVAMISPITVGSFISTTAIPARTVREALEQEPDLFVRQQLASMFSSMMR